MRFIPAKESDLFKLSYTSRKSSSRTTSGAKFISHEKGLTKRERLAEIVREVQELGAEFSNTRLVYVCK